VIVEAGSEPVVLALEILEPAESPVSEPAEEDLGEWATNSATRFCAVAVSPDERALSTESSTFVKGLDELEAVPAESVEDAGG